MAAPSVTSLASDKAKDTSIEVLFQELASSPSGLSTAEAQARLRHVGPNALPEKRVSPLVQFLAFFWGPIPWMIEIAALLSAVVGHWQDFAIIMVLLFFNAGIGFWQEYKAGNAIAALKKSLALTARVRREGEWTEVAAAELVPGDVIRVRLGDIVPADAKLMSSENMAADQSALTGESLPVDKVAGDLLYSGSVVQKGEGDALIHATGTHTFFGKTAQLVAEAKTVSHYQQAVIRIGQVLIGMSIILIIIILLVSLHRHEPFLETVQFVLILAVASIPVALPAVLSVTMAVGALRLSKEKAIVSKLVAIEEMAGLDVFCSDKTGTLTQNKLQLGDTILFSTISEQEVIRNAVLASRLEDNDPIEIAIFNKLEGGKAALNGFTVKHFSPFDPVTKQTAALIDSGGGEYEVRKGAPQVIAALCDDPDLQRRVADKVNEMAGRGFRTLGVASKGSDGQWYFTGLLSMFDPPRDDSAATIQAAIDMGLGFKMVTGDHLAIAKETARQLRMGTNIYPADQVFAKDSPFTPEQIEQADGFAQVFPEHKYQIVEVLQQRGHYVGMTGDGVNDAPALKKADAGVAVSGATDAARSAAALVLTAPGLSVIITAIQEARRIFERMTSYAIYRISETIAIMIFMTLAILLFQVYPLSAVMIIFLALLNDGPIMMIAYDNVQVNPGPVKWDMRWVMFVAGVLGVMSVTFSFLLYWLGREWAQPVALMHPDVQSWIGSNILVGLREVALPTLRQATDPDQSQIATLIFLKLTICGHLSIYMARTGAKPFWTRPFPNWKLLAVCEGTQLIGLLLGVYGFGLMAGVGWGWGVFLLFYALFVLFVTDAVKVGLCRVYRAGWPWLGRHLRHAHTPLHGG